MNWLAIQAAIEARVAAMTGLEADGDIVWSDAPEEFGRSHARITLWIATVTQVGQDEIRKSPPVGTANQVQMTCGQRQLVLRVRIGSWDPVGDPALSYADKIRARIKWEGNAEAFRAAGLAVAEVLEVSDFQYEEDERKVNTVVMSITFNAAENDTDTDPGSGNYIETADVTGALAS